MASHLFISYSKKDAEFAFKLADDLSAQGRKLWIDRQIGGGERWRSSILEALRDAQAMIVILSPHSVESEWVMHEGSVASGLEKPIFPILMEPVTHLPVWMEELQFIDFANQPYETGFAQLVDALTPPNYLQDMLDQQVDAYQRTQALIGEALLHVFDEQSTTLVISAEAQALIDKSKRAVAYRQRLVRASAGAAILLSIVAVLAGLFALGAGTQVTTALNEVATAQAQKEISNAQVTAAAQAAEEAQIAVSTAEAAAATAGAERARANADLATATIAIGQAEDRLKQANLLFAQLYSSTGTIPVGDRPVALAWDGVHMWVANRQAGSVMPIDLSQGIPLVTSIPTINVGGTLEDIIVGGGSAWVARADDRTLVRIDLATLRPEGDPIELDAQPVALAWGDQALWIAAQGEPSLLRLDPVSLEVTTLATLDADPTALLWTETRLWVALENDAVLAFDPTGSEPVLTTSAGEGPAALAWDGTTVWVANSDGDTVTQLDPLTGESLGDDIDVGRRPSALVWDGVNLWVVNSSDNNVMQIGPTDDVGATMDVISSVEVGNRPRGAIWTGQRLWVALSDDDAVKRVDIEDKAVEETVSTGNTPDFVVWTGTRLSFASTTDNTFRHIDPLQPSDPRDTQLTAAPVDMVWTGSQLWVARADRQIQQVFPDGTRPGDLLFTDSDLSAITWDGTRLWLTSPNSDDAAGTLFSYDVETRTRSAETIAVGADPADVVWDGTFLWVANRGDATVSRVNPADGERLTIQVGDEPSALLWDGSSVWVANTGSDTVWRLSPEGQIVTIKQVDDQPVALAWDGEALWVASRGNNTVTQIDPQQSGAQAVQAVLAVGEQPIALTNDGSRVWVTSRLGTIQRLNTRSLILVTRARRLIALAE